MGPASIEGAWRLETCEARDDDGGVLLPLGDAPVGLLVYEASGIMSVAIMRAEHATRDAREASADILDAAPDARARAGERYMSYAGRWTLLDGGARVRHDVEISLFPGWIGQSQERRVTLDGDVLVLSTDPMPLGKKTRVATMRWRRARHVASR
jgi:hypothetical protein